MNEKSQKLKILNLLQENEWVCTSHMYALYIADVRRRLCDLKESGYDLVWRWCKTHPHKKSKEWKLNVLQNQDPASRQIIQPSRPPARQNALPIQLSVFTRNDR